MKVLVNTQAQAHSAFLLMLLCLLGFLQKNCFFIVFCVNHNPNPCIMWRSCENPRKHTSIHFCDVAKKSLFYAQNHMKYLHKRVRKPI